MTNRDDVKPLSLIIQLDDAYLGGKKSDGNRGRGAPGKSSFLAAVSVDIYGNPLHMRLSKVAGFTINEVERCAHKHLDPRSIVVTDGLPCFSAIQSIGCGHEAIITRRDSKGLHRKVFKWVNTMIGNVKNSIRGTYHAISHKHLPRYFAEFCYRFNLRFWEHELPMRLLNACLAHVLILETEDC